MVCDHSSVVSLVWQSARGRVSSSSHVTPPSISCITRHWTDNLSLRYPGIVVQAVVELPGCQ